MLRIIPLEDRIVLDADSQEIIDPSCTVWYAQDGQAVTSIIVPEESIQAWSWDWVAPGKEKVSVIVTDARVGDFARVGQEGVYIFQYSGMASVQETLDNFHDFLKDADIEEVDHLAFAGTLTENIQDTVKLIQGLKQYTSNPVDMMQSFLTANTALYQTLIESEVPIAVSNDAVGGSGSDWTLESQQVHLLDHYFDAERVSYIDRPLGIENIPFMDYQVPLSTEVVQVLGNSIWNIEAEDSEAIWTLREEPLLSFDYQVYNSDEEDVTEYILYDNEAYIFDLAIDLSTYQGTILRLLLTQEELDYATSHAVMVLGSNDRVQLLGSPLSQHLNKGDAILSFQTDGRFAMEESSYFDLVVTQGEDLEDVSELFEIDTEKKEILLVSDMLDPSKGALHFEVLVGELDIPLSSFKVDFMNSVNTEKAESTVSGQSIVQAASASDELIVQFSVEDNYKAFWESAGLYEKIEDQYLLVSLEKDLVNPNGEFYLPNHLNAGVYLILAQEETTGARAFFELTITPAILPFAFNPSYSTSIVPSTEIGEEIVRLWESVPDEVSHVELQGSNDVSLNGAQTAVILSAPLEGKSSLDFSVKLLDEKENSLYEKSFELGISKSNTEIFSPTVIGPNIQSPYSELFQIESILPEGYSYVITEGYEIESGLIFPPEDIEEGPQAFTLAVIDPNETTISEVEIKYDYIASFRSEGVRSQQGVDDSVYLYPVGAPFFAGSTVSISGLAEAARISPALFQDRYLDELFSTSLEDTEDSALGLIASVLETYPEKNAQALQSIYEERSSRLEDETIAGSLYDRYLRTVSSGKDVESFANSFKENYLTELVTRFTFAENTSLEDVQNYQRFVASLDSELDEVKTVAIGKIKDWFNSLSEERREELFESRDLRTLKELAQSQWALAFLQEEGVDVESEWEANSTYLKELDFDTLSITQLSNVFSALREDSPESLVSVLETNDFNFDAPSLQERFQLALSLASIESQDSIIEDKVYTFIEKLADEIAQAASLSDEVKLIHLNKLTELYGIENYERVRLFSLLENGSSWTASEAQAILNFAYVEDSLEAWQFVGTAASNRLDLGSSSSTLLYGAVLQSHPDFLSSSAVAFQTVLEEGKSIVSLIPDFEEGESSILSLTAKADDASNFSVYSTSQKLTSLLGQPIVRIEYLGDELEEGYAITLSEGALEIGKNLIVSGGDLVLLDSTALPDEGFEQTLRILDHEGTVLFEKVLTFNQDEIEDNVLILNEGSRALLFGANLVFDTSNASIDPLDSSEVLEAALMSAELPFREVLSILSPLKDREGFEEIIENTLDTWAQALVQEDPPKTAEELLSQLEERKSYAFYLAWDTRAGSTLKKDFVGNIFSQDIGVLSSGKEKADYLTTLSEIYIALEDPEEAFDAFKARTTMVIASLEPPFGEESVRQALASGYPQALAQVYSHLSAIFLELDREGLDELFSPGLLEASIPQLISAIKSEIHHPQYFDYFTDIASILSVLDLSENKEIALELYSAAEESNFFSTVAAETWFANLRPFLDIVRSDMELTLSRLEEVAIDKLQELEPISSAAQYSELLVFAKKLPSYAFHAALIERLDFSTLEFEKSLSQDIVQLSDQIAEIKVAQEVKRELQVALLTANKGLQREELLDTGAYDLADTATDIYIRDGLGVVAGYRVETDEAVDVLYRVLEEDALDAFSLQGSARDELPNPDEWIWKQTSDGSVSILAMGSFLTDTTLVSFSDGVNYESVKTLRTYGEFKNDLSVSLEKEEYGDRVRFAGYADEDVFDLIREQLGAATPESSLEFLALLQPIAEYLDLTQKELPEDIRDAIQGIAVSDLLEEEKRPEIVLKVYDGLSAVLGNNEDAFKDLLEKQLASIDSPETSQDYRQLSEYTRILAENFLEADDDALDDTLKEQVEASLATLLSNHIEDSKALVNTLSAYQKYSEIYGSSPEIENALIQKGWEALPQASVQLADTAQALLLLRELDESFATAPAFDVALENYIQSLSSKSKSEKIELLQALRFIELKAEESAGIIDQLSLSTDRMPSTEDYLLLDAAYRSIGANPIDNPILTIQYTFQDEVPASNVIDVSIQVDDEPRVIERRFGSISTRFGFATQIRQGDPLVVTYDETTSSSIRISLPDYPDIEQDDQGRIDVTLLPRHKAIQAHIDFLDDSGSVLKTYLREFYVLDELGQSLVEVIGEQNLLSNQIQYNSPLLSFSLFDAPAEAEIKLLQKGRPIDWLGAYELVENELFVRDLSLLENGKQDLTALITLGEKILESKEVALHIDTESKAPVRLALSGPNVVSNDSTSSYYLEVEGMARESLALEAFLVDEMGNTFDAPFSESGRIWVDSTELDVGKYTLVLNAFWQGALVDSTSQLLHVEEASIPSPVVAVAGSVPPTPPVGTVVAWSFLPEGFSTIPSSGGDSAINYKFDIPSLEVDLLSSFHTAASSGGDPTYSDLLYLSQAVETLKRLSLSSTFSEDLQNQQTSYSEWKEKGQSLLNEFVAARSQEGGASIWTDPGFADFVLTLQDGISPDGKSQVIENELSLLQKEMPRLEALQRLSAVIPFYEDRAASDEALKEIVGGFFEEYTIRTFEDLSPKEIELIASIVKDATPVLEETPENRLKQKDVLNKSLEALLYSDQDLKGTGTEKGKALVTVLEALQSLQQDVSSRNYWLALDTLSTGARIAASTYDIASFSSYFSALKDWDYYDTKLLISMQAELAQKAFRLAFSEEYTQEQAEASLYVAKLIADEIAVEGSQRSFIAAYLRSDVTNESSIDIAVAPLLEQVVTDETIALKAGAVEPDLPIEKRTQVYAGSETSFIAAIFDKEDAQNLTVVQGSEFFELREEKLWCLANPELQEYAGSTVEVEMQYLDRPNFTLSFEVTAQSKPYFVVQGGSSGRILSNTFFTEHEEFASSSDSVTLSKKTTEETLTSTIAQLPSIASDPDERLVALQAISKSMNVNPEGIDSLQVPFSTLVDEYLADLDVLTAGNIKDVLEQSRGLFSAFDNLLSEEKRADFADAMLEKLSDVELSTTSVKINKVVLQDLLLELRRDESTQINVEEIEGLGSYLDEDPMNVRSLRDFLEISDRYESATLSSTLQQTAVWLENQDPTHYFNSEDIEGLEAYSSLLTLVLNSVSDPSVGIAEETVHVLENNYQDLQELVENLSLGRESNFTQEFRLEAFPYVFASIDYFKDIDARVIGEYLSFYAKETMEASRIEQAVHLYHALMAYNTSQDQETRWYATNWDSLIVEASSSIDAFEQVFDLFNDQVKSSVLSVERADEIIRELASSSLSLLQKLEYEEGVTTTTRALLALRQSLISLYSEETYSQVTYSLPEGVTSSSLTKTDYATSSLQGIARTGAFSVATSEDLLPWWVFTSADSRLEILTSTTDRGDAEIAWQDTVDENYEVQVYVNGRRIESDYERALELGSNHVYAVALDAEGRVISEASQEVWSYEEEAVSDLGFRMGYSQMGAPLARISLAEGFPGIENASIQFVGARTVLGDYVDISTANLVDGKLDWNPPSGSCTLFFEVWSGDERIAFIEQKAEFVKQGERAYALETSSSFYYGEIDFQAKPVLETAVVSQDRQPLMNLQYQENLQLSLLSDSSAFVLSDDKMQILSAPGIKDLEPGWHTLQVLVSATDDADDTFAVEMQELRFKVLSVDEGEGTTIYLGPEPRLIEAVVQTDLTSNSDPSIATLWLNFYTAAPPEWRVDEVSYKPEGEEYDKFYGQALEIREGEDGRVHLVASTLLRDLPAGEYWVKVVEASSGVSTVLEFTLEESSSPFVMQEFGPTSVKSSVDVGEVLRDFVFVEDFDFTKYQVTFEGDSRAYFDEIQRKLLVSDYIADAETIEGYLRFYDREQGQEVHRYYISIDVDKVYALSAEIVITGSTSSHVDAQRVFFLLNANPALTEYSAVLKYQDGTETPLDIEIKNGSFRLDGHLEVGDYTIELTLEDKAVDFAFTVQDELLLPYGIEQAEYSVLYDPEEDSTTLVLSPRFSSFEYEIVGDSDVYAKETTLSTYVTEALVANKFEGQPVENVFLALLGALSTNEDPSETSRIVGEYLTTLIDTPMDLVSSIVSGGEEFLGKLVETLRGFGLEEFVRTSVLLEKILNEEGVTFAQGLTEDVFGAIAPTLNLFLEGVASVINLYSPLEDLIADQVDLVNIEAYTQSLRLVYPYLQVDFSEDVKAIFKGLSENVLGKIKDSQPELYLSSVLDLFIARVYDSGDLEEEFISTLTDNPTLLLKSIRAFFYEPERFADLSEEWRTAFQDGVQEIETTIAQASLSELIPYLDARATIDKIPELERDATMQVDWNRYYDEIAQLEPSTRIEVLTTAYESLAEEEDVFRTVLGNMLNEATKQVLTLSSWTFDELTSVLIAVSKADPATRQDLLLSILDELPPNQEALSLFIYAWATEQKNPTYSIELESSMGDIEAASLNFYYGDALSEEKTKISFSPYEEEQWVRVATVDKVSSKTQLGDRIALIDLNGQLLMGMPLSIVDVDGQEIPELIVREGLVFWNSDESPTDSLRVKVKVGNEIQEQIREIAFDGAAEASYQVLAYDTLADEAGTTSFWILPERERLYFSENELLALSDSALTLDSLYAKDYLEKLLSDISPSSLEDLSPSEQLEALGYFLGNIRFFEPDATVASIFQNGVDALLPLLSDADLWQGDSLQTLDHIFTLWVDSASFIEELSNFGDGIQLDAEKVELAYATLEKVLSEKVLSIPGQEPLDITQQQLADQPAGGLNPQYLQSASRFIADPNIDSALITFESLESQSSIEDRFDETVAFLKNSGAPVDLIALKEIQESFAKALEYKSYTPGLLDYINNLDLSALNSLEDKLEALQLTRSMLDRVDGVNSVLMDEALESLAFTARALAKEAFWADNEIVETSARVLQYSSLQQMMINPALSYRASQMADDVELSEVEITRKEFERSSQVSIPLSLASDTSSDDEEGMGLVKKKNVALVFDDFLGTSYTEVVSNFIAESYQELTLENLRQAALYFSGSSLMELASTVESIPHFIKEYAYNALGPKTTEELTQELALYAKLKAEVPNGDWYDSDVELFAIFQSHILSLTGQIQAMNFATLSSEDWQDLEGLLNLSVTAYNAFGEDFSTQLLSSIKQLSERFPDDFIATVTHILNTLSPTQVVAKAEVYYKFLEVQLKLLIEDPGAEEVAQNIGDLIAKYPSNLEKLYENLLDGTRLKLDLMDTILALREGVEDDLSLLWTKFLESAKAYIENPELPADSLVALVDIFMQFQEANSTQEGGIHLAEFVQQAIQDRIDELSFEGLVSIFAHYPTLQSILEEGGVVYMNLSELMLTEILNQPWTLEGVSHLLDSIQDLEGDIIENLQSSIYAYLVDEVRLGNFEAISSLLKLYKVVGMDSVKSIGKLLVYADEQTTKKAKLYSCSSACEPLQQAAVLKNLLTDGSSIYHTNGYFPYGWMLYSDTSDLNLKTAYEVFEDYLLSESDAENAFSALSVYWNNDWEKTLDPATEQRVVENFLETLTVANISMLSALIDKTEYYGDVLEALEKVEWNELNDEAMRVFASFLEGSPGDALNSERWATLAETVYEQITALSNSSLEEILLKQDLLQSFINTSDDAVNEVSALFDDFVAQYEAIRDGFSLENTLLAHLENATTLTQLFQIEDRFQQFFNWYTNFEELSEQVNIIDTIHAALASASFDLQTYLMNHPIDGAEQVATFFKALVASSAAGTVNEGVLQDLLDSALLIFDDSEDDATTRVNSLIDMYLSLDELPLDYSKNVLREALTKRLSEALGNVEDEIKERIFKRVLYNPIKGGLKNVIAETAVASGEYVWAALSAPYADSFFAYEYVDALPQDLYTKAFDAISSLNREYRHNEHEDTCEEEESQATQREGRRGCSSYSLQQLSSYQAVIQNYNTEADISILIDGHPPETSKGFTFNLSTGVLDASFAAPGLYMVMWEASDGQQGELAFHVQPSYAPDMYELVYEGYQTLSSLEVGALLGQLTYTGHVENAYYEIQHLQTLDGEDVPVDSLKLEDDHLFLEDLIPESVRVQVVLRTSETILDDIWFTLTQEVADDYVGRLHLTTPQAVIVDAHSYENFGQVRGGSSDSWVGSIQLVQGGETFYFDEDSREVILHERPVGLASYTLERVDEDDSVLGTVTKEFYFASQEGTIDLTVAPTLKNTLKAGAVVVENIQFDGRGLDEFVLKLSSSSAEFLELGSDENITLRSDLLSVEPGKYILELELRTDNGTLLATVHKEFTLQAQSSLRGVQEVVKDWDLHKPISEVELNVGWKDEYKVEILDDSRDFFVARKEHIFVKEAFFTSEEDSRVLKYRVVDKYTHTIIAESMELIKLSDYETPANADIHIVLPSYTIPENTPVDTSLGTIELLGEGDEGLEVVLLNSGDSFFSLQGRELTISKPVDFEQNSYISLTFKVLRGGEIVDLETQIISVGDVYDPNDYSSRLVFAYGVDSVSNVFSDEGAVFTSSAVSAQGSDIWIEDEYSGTYQIQNGEPQTIEVKTLENLVFKISEDFALDTIDVYALFNESTSSTLTQSSLTRKNEDLWELDARFLRQDGTVVIHAARVETVANEIVKPFAQPGEEVSASLLPFFPKGVMPYSAVSESAKLTIRDDFSYTYLLEEGVTAKVLLYGSNGLTEVHFTSETVISPSESATPPATMIQTSTTPESAYTAVGKVLQSKMDPKAKYAVRSVILDENSRPSSAQTNKGQLIANDPASPAGTRSSYAEIFALGELIDLSIMKSAAGQQEEIEIQIEEATKPEEEVEVQAEVGSEPPEEPSNEEPSNNE